MRAKGATWCGRASLWRCLAVWGFAFAGCGGNDYYFVNDVSGEGDTIILHFIHTCGTIDVTWNGAFVGEKARAELEVKHDAADDCGEEPRDVPFDVGPMKRTFRETRPDPDPLGLRIPPYQEEQGAICLSNLFQEVPFKGLRCK